MSIATAIQNAQTKVAAAYASAGGKGATMPAVQDLSGLVGTINSIPAGGEVDEYANVISIENMMRGTSENEQTVVANACNDISQFLYGTDNN